MQNMAEITVNNKLAIADRRFLNQNTRSCICFSDEASHRFLPAHQNPFGQPCASAVQISHEPHGWQQSTIYDCYLPGAKACLYASCSLALLRLLFINNVPHPLPLKHSPPAKPLQTAEIIKALFHFRLCVFRFRERSH